MAGRTRLAAAAIVVAAGIATTAASALGTPEARVARTVGVTVGDDFYRPASLSVPRGTIVRWTWRGRDEHDVTVTSGPARFASPVQRRGTFTRTLRRRGTYVVVCTIHGQRMTIRVR